MHIIAVHRLGTFQPQTDMKLREMTLEEAYKVKIRKLFNNYKGLIIAVGGSRQQEIGKRDYLTAFQEVDLSFFYDYQGHLQKIIQVKFCLCS